MRLRADQGTAKHVEQVSGRRRKERLKGEDAAAVVPDVRSLLARFRLVSIVVVNVQERQAAMRLH